MAIQSPTPVQEIVWLEEHVIKTAQIVSLSSLLQAALGVYVAFAMAALEAFPLHKALTSAGIFFDIIGVVVFSRFLVLRMSGSPAWLDYLYAFFLMFPLIGPLFGVIALAFSPLFGADLPSFDVAIALFSAMLLYVGVPLFAIDCLSDALAFRFYKHLPDRVDFMGWYLLVSGLALQFVASVLDLAGSG